MIEWIQYRDLELYLQMTQLPKIGNKQQAETIQMYRPDRIRDIRQINEVSLSFIGKLLIFAMTFYC